MTFLILFIASLLGGYIFPWWWPAIAAYAVGCWFPRKAGSAFLSGFMGVAMAWIALAGFLDYRNHHFLSAKMAEVFHLPSGIAVLVVTGVIGGLMGGFGAWAGFALRAYLKPRFPEMGGPITEGPEPS